MALLVMTLGLSAVALEPQYYASSSALAEGRWVKIKVSETGMQEVTAAQLREMGFDDISRVGVYGFSAIDIAGHTLSTSHPDDVPPVPSIVEADKLIFYGESGIRTKVQWSSGRLIGSYEQNYTSLHGCYFLHEEDSPLRLEHSEAPSHPGNIIPTSYRVDLHIPLEENLSDAGAYYLSRNIATTGPGNLTCTFSPSHQVPEVAPWYSLQYIAGGSKDPVKVTVREAVYTYTPTTTTVLPYVKSITGAKLPADATDVVMDITATPGLEVLAVNYVAMTYRRQNVFEPGRTQMDLYLRESIAAGTAIGISDIDAGNLEVWKIAGDAAPERLTVVPSDGEWTGSLAVNSTSASGTVITRYIAFKPSEKLHEVETIGQVMTSNLHALPVPAMLIVTTERLMEEARRLSELHRDLQGMEVAVVDVEHIYNEFSSGTPSVDAIRRFAKMLYDRDPEKLRHLLIVGSATTNPRGIGSKATRYPTPTDIPAYATENLTNQFNESRCYSTDAFYAKLADGPFKESAVMNINVGRIPASESVQVAVYTDKIARYMMTPPDIDLRSHAVVIADRGNSSGHILQCEELDDMIISASPSTLVSKIYDEVYEYDGTVPSRHREILTERLKDGVGLMTYAGHSNYFSIGSAMLWTVLEVNKTRMTYPPFVTLASCDTYPFDRQIVGNIGEQMIFAPNGGAVALVGACRTVQMNYNHRFNKGIIKEYYSPGSGTTTLGDVFRVAHNAVVDNNVSGLTANTLCYNYGGDPAIPLYTYNRSISLAEGAQVSLRALSADNIISGTITDSGGAVDETFRGSIMASLYTPSTTVNLLKHENSDTLKTVSVSGHLLASARADIDAGHFTLRFDCPVPGVPGSDYMLLLSALSSGSFDLAALAVDGVSVEDAASDGNEPVDGPEIESFTAEVIPSVEDGGGAGCVAFRARIIPAGYSLAAGSSLTRTNYIDIDGTHYLLARHLAYGNDGVATLDFRVDDLSAGDHTATLSVADYADNRSEAKVSFTLIDSREPVEMDANTYIARDNVTFSLNHDLADGMTGRLVITDHTGATVFTTVGSSFPFTWNLDDSEGHRVPDGRYTARAWISHGHNRFESTSVTINVIEN